MLTHLIGLAQAHPVEALVCVSAGLATMASIINMFAMETLVSVLSEPSERF